MTLPYAEPLSVIDPAELVLPEPPRRGEEGGEPCFPCSGDSDSNLLWSDQHWTLHNPGQTGLPGSVWLASRTHRARIAGPNSEQKRARRNSTDHPVSKSQIPLPVKDQAT